jgi:hypothetical protein
MASELGKRHDFHDEVEAGDFNIRSSTTGSPVLPHNRMTDPQPLVIIDEPCSSSVSFEDRSFDESINTTSAPT